MAETSIIPVVSVRSQTHPFAWFADRNPFYLLSACCVLTGCWLLAGSRVEDLGAVAMKTGAVLFYQAAVVGVSLWLVRRPDMRRDVAILSMLSLLLASDIVFFYTQTATLQSVAAAAAFACFGTAQALAVAGLLLRGLGVPFAPGARWLVAADLAAVHLAPWGLRCLSADDAVLPSVFLAAFGLAGALLACHALPACWRTAGAATAWKLPAWLAVIAPAVALGSLGAHLMAMRWVYEVSFFPVFVSPVFLGVAALCLRAQTRRDPAISISRLTGEIRLGEVAPGAWAGVLALAAVLFALGDPPDLRAWHLDETFWWSPSPLRFVLILASAVGWCSWRLRRRKWTLFWTSFLVGAALLGHTPDAILRHVGGFWQWAAKLCSGSLPVTRTGWGVCLLGAAFLLLGAGALVSRWKAKHADRKPAPVPVPEGSEGGMP